MRNDFRPYVGPRPFERKDQALFFGRDDEAGELLARVIAHPVVLIYSQSGAGKTSLINARLIPLLEEEGFEVLPLARVRGQIPKGIAPGRDINHYVFNALMNWAGEAVGADRLSEMSINDYFSEARPAKGEAEERPRVAVFDQFEELFTFYPERWKERQEFFEQLSHALEAHRMLRVVFAMREDYIAELDPYASDLPENLRTRFRLEQLREGAALSAIRQPLRDTGLSFAEGVAERLVANLLKIQVKTATGVVIEKVGQFVEPVQLQVVCQALWMKMRESGDALITEDHIRAFGDVDQALSSFYESSLKQAVRATGINEGELRRWFQHTLITPVGTRGTVFRGQEQAGGIPNEAVDALEERHLIRVELRGGARWYELTHDRLIEPIKMSNQNWLLQLSAAEETRRWLGERAAAWVRGGRGDEGLLGEGELSRAKEFLESPDAATVGYDDAMVALVQASRATLEEEAHRRDRLLAAERQRRTEAERLRAEEQRLALSQARTARRLRYLTVALALACLIAAAGAVAAYRMMGVAEENSRKAEEERLKAEDAQRQAEDALRREREAQKEVAEKSALASTHAQAAQEAEASAAQNKALVQKIDDLTREAMTSVNEGRSERAIVKYKELLRLQREYAAKTGNLSGVVRTLINLGEMNRQRRDYASAYRMYSEAFSIRKRVLGEEHQDTAAILHDLARLHADWGKPAQAISYYRQTLRIWSKVLGSNDPSVVSARHKLADLEAKRRKD